MRVHGARLRAGGGRGALAQPRSPVFGRGPRRPLGHMGREDAVAAVEELAAASHHGPDSARQPGNLGRRVGPGRRQPEGVVGVTVGVDRRV